MSGMAVFFFLVCLLPLLSGGTSPSWSSSLLPACTAMSTCSSPPIFSVDDDGDECTLLLLLHTATKELQLQLLVPTTSTHHGPIHDQFIGKSPPTSAVEMDAAAAHLGALVEAKDKLPPFILRSNKNKQHLAPAAAGAGYDSIIPEAPNAESHSMTKGLAEKTNKWVEQNPEAMEKVKLKQGLRSAMAISSDGNAHLQESQFWRIDKEDPASCAIVMKTSLGLVYLLAYLLQPSMPFFSREVLRQLYLSREDVSFCEDKGETALAKRPWDFVPAGHKIGKPTVPLFQDLKDERIEFFRSKFAGSQAERAHAGAKKVAEKIKGTKLSGQAVIMACRKVTVLTLMVLTAASIVLLPMKLKLNVKGWNLHLLVTVLLMLIINSVPSVSSADPLHAHINFNLNDGVYETFYEQLRKELTDGSEPINGHYVLTKEVTGPPGKWIDVALTGDGKEATLYFRDDNLYLLMFANMQGQLFYMDSKDKNGEYHNNKVVPKEANLLPFGESYQSLTNKPGEHDDDNDDDDGDGDNNNNNNNSSSSSSVETASLLKSVALGQTAALYAINALADYKDGVSPVEPVKSAILAFCFMIAEAQRIKEIGTKCKDNRSVTTHVTKTEAEYAQVWGKLCKLWCRGFLGNAFTKIQGDFNLKSINEVGNIIDLVKKKNGKFCEAS